ncbi:Cathepsin L-like protein [Fragariocoptes setiger]|uniref:Cathepsin L-like protein n=1 Tax=Fragariocoptes setiger TaxID=1670756 RepID=A0ABQ7S9G3_9ACAR|nr:Cathepsin L-like protein [Fragariocoptes setiger]
MHSYTQAINRFSDMEYTEIIAKRTGLRVPSDVKSRSTPRSELAALEAISDGDVPASVDWRTKGAVTEVKNQGDCGACWAFAATGALEAAHFLKSGKLVSLSEQNLMDCSWPYGNRGCDGGLMENAYKYVIYHGLDTEQSYPFIGHNGECMFNKSSIGTTETSFIDLQHEDELALKKAVALHGPVSVGFAVTRGLSKYEKGVFHDEECEATEMNHAVLIVGYGTDPNEGDYWIVKNSWDTWWGEDGYFRVARNKKNMCHIASWAVYPIPRPRIKMNIRLVLLVALVVATTGCLVKAESKLLSPHKLLLTEWEHFKLVHGKVYESNAEEDRRFKIYLNNRLSIAKHNLEHAKGMHSYTQAINRFSDMEYTEIIAKRTGLRVPSDVKSRSTPRSELAALEAISDGDVPASVDWRTKGAVTEVKNQGDFDSGWAFAAGAHALKTGKLVSLSEQNLMDCSWKFNNSSCNGGYMDSAYEYVIANHGLDSEQSNSYSGRSSHACRFSNSSIGTTETSYIDVPQKDELALKKAIALHGPVSVGIAVTHNFMGYSGCVFSDAGCETTEIDHGVLVVGYDSDPVYGDCWIVKNSWDTWWGDNGYIKMACNKNNMC